MSDIKLFEIRPDGVTQLRARSVALEKSLQMTIERNLEALLGVRFLASEYTTGKRHAGRIDTLGIDENGYPVILEFKRALNENVMNQGLFYLDWLLDHKGEFHLLVQEKLGDEAAKSIDWSGPRLLCIAGDFTKYDLYAVEQINRTIELIRYAKYGEELLLLELVNATFAAGEGDDGANQSESKKGPAAVSQLLQDADQGLLDLYEALKSFLVSLGDDVLVKETKIYVAFRRLKNFACVRPSGSHLVIWTKVDPGTLVLEEGFTRDVADVGHYGTGDLEIIVRSIADLEKAKPLLVQSYEAN